MQLSIIATFVYFYVYTSFKASACGKMGRPCMHRPWLNQTISVPDHRTTQRAYSRVFKRPVSFLPNLALASLAGVVNILVTMPMDVVVTRYVRACAFWAYV